MADFTVKAPCCERAEDGTYTTSLRDVCALDGKPWDFTVEHDEHGMPVFALSHYDCLNALKLVVADIQARLAAKGI